MIKEIFAHLVSQGEAELSTTVCKGYPDWARPEVTLPKVALELVNFGPGLPRTRIGQAQARAAAQFRFYVFARNEPELLGLLDTLVEWLGGDGASFTISGKRVDLAVQEGNRQDPIAGVQQEQHAFSIPILVNW